MHFAEILLRTMGFCLSCMSAMHLYLDLHVDLHLYLAGLCVARG